MDSKEIKTIVEELGFIGFDSYECKATRGRFSFFAFDDTEYTKNGYPNGLTILKDEEFVFKGMMPDTKEELLTLFKLLGIL